MKSGLYIKAIFLSVLSATSIAHSAPQVNGSIIFGDDLNLPIDTEKVMFNYPEDAVEASDGSIYISDTHAHVIKKISNGKTEVFAGTFSRGFNGDGKRLETQLATPTALLLTPDEKHLLFADSNNALIRLIQLESGDIETIAGVQGGSDLPLEYADANKSPIGYVSSLKFDHLKNLCFQTSKLVDQYAVSGGIYCIDPAGKIMNMTPEIGTTTDGIRDFQITDSYIDLTRSNMFYRAYNDGRLKKIELNSSHGKGMTTEGDEVFLGVHTNLYSLSNKLELRKVSSGYANISNVKKSKNGLLVVDSDQGILFRVNDSGREPLNGSSDLAHGAITSIAPYGRDKLLILDNQRPRIFIKDISTGEVSVWAGTGRQEWALHKADKSLTSFFYPSSIVTDSKSNVYIAEQHRIMKIDINGEISLYAGHEKSGDKDSTSPQDARFNKISGLSISKDDHIYVADTFNHKIKLISPSGSVKTIAGDGTIGAPTYGAPAKESRLNHPLSAIAKENGSFLISDSWNNTITEIDAYGITRPFAGKPKQTHYQGRGTYEGDGHAAVDSGLNTPASLAMDSLGNVYISDHFNHSIRVVSRDGIIQTFAGEIQGYKPNGKALNFPNGLLIVDKKIYAADSGNRLVLRYDLP